MKKGIMVLVISSLLLLSGIITPYEVRATGTQSGIIAQDLGGNSFVFFGALGSYPAQYSEYGNCFTANSTLTGTTNIGLSVVFDTSNDNANTTFRGQALLYKTTGGYSTTCKPSGNPIASSPIVNFTRHALPSNLGITQAPSYSNCVSDGCFIFNSSVILSRTNYAVSVRMISNQSGSNYFLISQDQNNVYAGGGYQWNGASFLTRMDGVGNLRFIVTGLVPSSEPQTVLFRDDFLYTNQLAYSGWTVDLYQSPVTAPGEYTASGYLNLRAQSTSTIETVHVNDQIFNNTLYNDGTIVKRKMTVAFIPFARTETGTADFRVGLAPLLTTGTYPGNTPYGTPFYDSTNNCQGGGGNNAVGLAYMIFSNNGTVKTVTCTDIPATAVSNRTTLETLTPSRYTVFTVETSGIFCSSCTDKAIIGSSWVWFRAYQEDGLGSLISSSDKSLNFTSKVAPLFQPVYAFATQTNNNAGATNQITKIDFIQVQNYGSPVCLTAPSGALCSRLPLVPVRGWGSSITEMVAYLSNLIGFGDEQIGAVFLFVFLSGIFAGIPFFLTRNIMFPALGELSILGFFIYAGFLPLWVLFIPILLGVVIVVMMVNRMVSGSSLMGGGGGGNE